MRFRPMIGKTAIVGASLLAAMACGKKKSSSSAAASGAVEPNDDTLVTLATGALQLAGEVTILQGKESGTSLALNSKEVSFKLMDERTVRLRMTNEAFEDIEKSGEIMCILSQTKFWEQANAGVYQAQVDNNKCSRSNSGGGGGGEGGDSSDNQAPDLQVVYVKSVREENKPLIAEMRVAANEGKGEDVFYHVKVVVVEPPSDAAPAGIFDMRYTAHMGTQVGESGFIRTKKTAGDKFVLESGGNGSGGEGRTNKSQGIAELEVLDENTVIGYVHSDSAGTEGQYSYTSKGQARFDDKFLNVDYVTSNTSPQGTNTSDLKGCYDLNKYKTAMFRYDLVDSTGKVVQRNSGFPVEFTKDGQTRHGWAGYYGLWLGESGSVATGDTVNKVTWGNGTKSSTPYTVFAAPGKLTKMTKATVTLGELKGVDLNFWDGGSNYIVKWDGSTLSKTAKITNGNNGPEEEAASGAVTIPQWGANIWIPSLNANIQISSQMTLADSLSLSYHSQKIVSGTADVPTCELKCYQNCPVMAPAASAFERSQGGQGGPMVSALYKTTSVNWGGGAQEVNQAQNVSGTALATYTWDASTQNLKEGSTAFALPSGLSTDQSSSQNMQNVFSGALICASDWTAIPNKESLDPWRMANEVTTFYSFQSGSMDWNKFIGLKDSTGAFVAFDAPLELSYTHTTANDWDGNTDTSFIGKSFRLQYSGPGNLQGIPWKYSKDTGHHMPLFSIKSGATVGAYKIYPIDGEQRLAKAEAASCAAIPLEGAPELPSLDSLTAVDVGSIGDASSELRYVGGVAVE